MTIEKLKELFKSLDPDDFDSVSEPISVHHLRLLCMMDMNAIMMHGRLNSDKDLVSEIASLAVNAIRSTCMGMAMTPILPRNVFKIVYPIGIDVLSRVVKSGEEDQKPDWEESRVRTLPGLLPLLDYFDFVQLSIQMSVLKRMAALGLNIDDLSVAWANELISSGRQLFLRQGLMRAEILFLLPFVPKEWDELFRWYLASGCAAARRDGLLTERSNLPAIVQCRLSDPRQEIRRFARKMQAELKGLADFNQVCPVHHLDGFKDKRSAWIDRQDVEELIQAAIELGNQGWIGDALILVSDALRIDPDNMHARRNLGHGLMRAGLNSLARPILQGVIDNGSEWAGMARASLSEVETSEDRHDIALQYSRDTLANEDNAVETMTYRTMISIAWDLMNQEQFGLVEQALQIADRIGPPERDSANLADMTRFLLGARKGDPQYTRKYLSSLDDEDAWQVEWLLKAMESLHKNRMFDEMDVLIQKTHKLLVHSTYPIWITAFNLLFAGFVREKDRPFQPVHRRIIDLLERPLSDVLPFHALMIQEFQQNPDLMMFLSNLPPDQFVETGKTVGDYLYRVAPRCLDPAAFHYRQLADLYKICLLMSPAEILPWPSAGSCECGDHLRQHVFCDCGHRFDDLDDDFFQRFPARELICPECGSSFNAFVCDSCQRIYSWLLEG